ncbi:MAG: hypothetical protein ACTS4W_00815 [Candidatus Hodgkinia cicadicola]
MLLPFLTSKHLTQFVNINFRRIPSILRSEVSRPKRQISPAEDWTS